AGARLAGPMTQSRAHRVLYRDAAIADGRSDRLQRAMSILVEDERIAWIRPADGEEDPGGEGIEVVDAGGATIVPGMVDGHSHLTLPGGSHWIDRIEDRPAAAVATAARNAELVAAGLGQIDAGADLIKLYLDGSDPAVCPWSSDEIARVVEAVHGRGGRVTAHSGRIDGARKGVAGGVDAIEHGFELDDELAA